MITFYLERVVLFSSPGDPGFPSTQLLEQEVQAAGPEQSMEDGLLMIPSYLTSLCPIANPERQSIPTSHP